MFGRRADATRVRNLNRLRSFMPFISPSRNGSVVYFDTEIEVEPALRLVDELNQSRPPEKRVTLFLLYIRTLAMHIYLRPHTNRFTAGGRLWQRNEGCRVGHASSVRGKQTFEDHSRCCAQRPACSRRPGPLAS